MNQSIGALCIPTPLNPNSAVSELEERVRDLRQDFGIFEMWPKRMYRFIYPSTRADDWSGMAPTGLSESMRIVCAEHLCNSSFEVAVQR